MATVDFFAFDKTLIFIVDENNSIVHINDELSCILSFYDACDPNKDKDKIPYYLRQLLFIDNGSFTLAFENGSLSSFCYSFSVKGSSYKYIMAVYLENEDCSQMGNNKNTSITDSLSGLFNRRALDVVQFCNGCVLFISISWGGARSRSYCDGFLDVIKNEFSRNDVVFRLSSDEFLIVRNSRLNDFNKNIISLKRKVVRLNADKGTDFWFLHATQEISSCDIYSVIMQAKRKLN